MANGKKNISKRVKTVKLKPADAVSIIQGAFFKAQQLAGISFLLVNTKDGNLGIIIPGTFHCKVCKSFVYGEMPASEICSACGAGK